MVGFIAGTILDKKFIVSYFNVSLQKKCLHSQICKNWSIFFAGLPKKENAELFNIHFCCCSDSVSALEMSQPLLQELILLETQGVEAYDALVK